ncbi:hypothetical protein FQR65_LT16484 [Abscondita terminalis]|nr:hypothetical protein FQR65_LT16484 [Abscondita terminalis]
MSTCAIYGCINNSTNLDPSIQFYCFPKHPVIAQQWVAACWSPDPIDVNTAQVCSLHFNISSYTSEYKRDFFGNYSKVLKFDSVPSLYLPYPPSTTTIKSDAQNNFGTDQTDLKESVGQIHPITNEIDNVLTTKTQSIKANQDNTSKCSLNQLCIENSSLQQSCDLFEIQICELNRKIEKQQKMLKGLDKEIKKVINSNEFLQQPSMSLADQKNILSKVFSESQIKILSGKKKIYWSSDDMAMGYTIRHLSNKRCYLYLSKKLNIPLPALSSIKRWSTLKKNEFSNESKGACKFEDEDSE